MNCSSVVTQTKKQKYPFSMSTLFVELISFLVNPSMFFNYDFDFIFFILTHDCELVKWNIREVRQASKYHDRNFMQKFTNNEVVSKYLNS